MEGQSEVQEQKRKATGKRRLSSSSSSRSSSSSSNGNASADVEMATATLSVPKEPCRSFSGRKRSNHKNKKSAKKDAASRNTQGECVESSSVVDASPSQEANRSTSQSPLDASESSTVSDPSPAPEPEVAMVVAAASSREDVPIIPGLSDNTALVILALIPLSYHQPLKRVCKKWQRCLTTVESTNEVLDMRKFQGVKETWVFLLASARQQRQQWRAFDPVYNRWRCLPQCPCDYTFNSCDKESAVAGTHLLVTGHSSTGTTVWRYDLHTNEWGKAAKMLQSRCLFASASHGKYAYFAGGSCEGSVISSAERYNSQTRKWEPLPDLHVSRKWCSGCILDNKFFVIGGQGSEKQALTSGEYYDESENRWVIVENMWPAARTQPPGQTAPPLVAVVKDQLYAADASTMELNAYHKGTNTWRPLGPVPYRSVDASGWGMGFKAVGDEIFVIGGSSDRGNGTFCDQIHAWPPAQMQNADGWRLVGQLPNTSGFIYNCAVMIV
ncbi:F-box/kelch-repeat protein At5g60570 [Physcomitrium patens]|uniref:F-box domain-containing protein n=1 Tax=Physcomitrium patens TaxID=3218 RepID=A0A2K1KA51_PHYPA|nr:F-box/kelch-repeat protein At5g60570-like [Physcomitrium patens]PNR50648.1 hypothetical protein PHYPA_009834 [Physcomitrium patens]|eukprot:XP_024380995.1 F-box/kelch-repeat protein At5g60570-like [Physcomitrella patens]